MCEKCDKSVLQNSSKFIGTVFIREISVTAVLPAAFLICAFMDFVPVVRIFLSVGLNQSRCKFTTSPTNIIAGEDIFFAISGMSFSVPVTHF